MSTSHTLLAPYTTVGLGGPAREILTCHTRDDLLTAVTQRDNALLLAGGSNVVISDEGFDGTVILLRTHGVRIVARDDLSVRVQIEAGHTLDEFIEWSVAEGLRGVECLTGIPGSVGATPIQNVGAYGQEIADVLHSVEVYDRVHRVVRTLTPGECALGYRTSALKRRTRFVVLSVTLTLQRAPQNLSTPLRFGQLTTVLGVNAGERAPLCDVRDSVEQLRRAKGMVLDASDADTNSCGSFFTNPTLSAAEFAAVQRTLEKRDVRVWELPHGGRKLSAASLIERAGFTRGYGSERVRVSSKHTLALTHRGGGSTKEFLSLAYEIRDTVRSVFGVDLLPEPVLIATDWLQ